MPFPAIAVVAGVALGTLATVMNVFPPFQRWLMYTSNNIMANAIPAEADLIRARYLGDVTPEQFSADMKRWGYASDYAELMFTNARSLPGLDDLVVLHWRGHISQSDLETRAGQLGFEPEIVDLYQKRREFYPGPADLVSFQAREVFEEDAVRRYGLDAEFEKLDLSAFHKAGMSDEQIRWYWRAHWQHPSWTQVQEFLHRGKMTEEEVEEWFRLVEIPPFWRQKFIETSYNPYTRVDARRMLNLGVIDRGEVKRNYLDQGYNEEKAENMTLLAEALQAGGDETGGKDLTRAVLTKGYRQGMMTGKAFEKALKATGYDRQEAGFLRSLEDEDEYQDALKEQIGLIIDRLVRGDIDEVEAANLLATYGLPDEKITTILNRATQRKENLIAMPAKSDVKNWLKHEVITEEEAREILAFLQYPSRYIDFFIRDWGGGPEREAGVAGALAGGGG